MRPTKYPLIAEKIRSDIESGHLSSPLPPVVELAARYCVSVQTAWKAVRLLSDRGLVMCAPGKKTRLAQEAEDVRGKPAWNRLADDIRNEISSGKIEAGSALPKSRFFSTTNHVSATTLTRALRRLADEGLIHQRGRSWIVGKPRISPRSAPGSHTPVVLVLFDSDWDWGNFFHNPSSRSFVSALLRELESAPVQLRVVMNQKEPTNGLRHFPIGYRNAFSLIDKLGDAYKGILIVNGHWFANTRRGQPLGFWLRSLSALRSPVVVYNHTNEETAELSAWDGPAQRLRYLHPDEASAVTRALAHCASRGHQNIAVPYTTSYHEAWMQQRLQAIVAAASASNPALNIVPLYLRENFWTQKANMIGIVGIVDATRMHGNRSRSKAKGQPSESGARVLAEGLGPIIHDKGVSCIIALNDLLAVKIYVVLESVGVRVPQDVSLISFDNIPETAPFPITTVDLGYGKLGYKAAHIFMDDIPVKADRRGHIPSDPEIVDRGSVGVPNPNRRVL